MTDSSINKKQDVQDYLTQGLNILENGQPSLAYEIFSEGLSLFPSHPRLNYLTALSLARAGSTNSAKNILEKLVPKLNGTDPLVVDAVSLLGRLAKGQWEICPSALKRSEIAQIALKHYQQAYQISGDYFPGINYASMLMLAGEKHESVRVARELMNLCAGLISDGISDYWLYATCAEACLLLGDQVGATGYYLKARIIAGKQFGNLASSRRQVKLLSNALEIDPAVMRALEMPKVATFTGHMLDQPDRLFPRFPAEAETKVASLIEHSINSHGVEFAYCSAACGADIIFIEAMLNRGAEVHVTLPFAKHEFIQTSVAFAGEQWVRRFEAVLDSVATVDYSTKEAYYGDNVLFDYCTSVIFGKCLLHANQLQAEPLLIAAISVDETASLRGGSLDNLQRWRNLGHQVDLINLANLDVAPPASLGAVVAETVVLDSQNPDLRNPRVIKVMLFADVVGFSKIEEGVAPNFFLNFLSAIAKVIDKHIPTFKNTWGDGLFMVYDDIESAANAALSIRDVVAETDWNLHGLPSDTNIRIGMHAGPVYSAFDPIIGSTNYFGGHVNRAARIEPITAPGTVYLTEQAACLLAISDCDDFICDHIGKLELAKNFGEEKLYCLNWSDGR